MTGFAASAAPVDDPLAGVLTMTDGGDVRLRFDELTFTGTARFVWSDGRSYSGDFVDGHPHGHGIEQLPDGSSYDGEWIEGRRDGNGTLNLSDGSRYDGQFAGGVRSGSGLFQSAAGRYQGEWADDVPQGEGRFDYTDGASYDGAWFAGRRNDLRSCSSTLGVPGAYPQPFGSTHSSRSTRLRQQPLRQCSSAGFDSHVCCRHRLLRIAVP